MRLLAEIDRLPDGRIEGRIRSEPAEGWQQFSGVLELLKVLQQALDANEQKSPDPLEAKETT
jgi:hypothetical protein